MAENYLITGYWGEPHVTAENDRGINAATFGIGRFVLPVGERFRAEYIGNNIIRMYDGKLLDNGAAAGIPAGEYVDLQIANAGQGMKRNDLVVFQYSRDASTMIESGSFVVVKGSETSGAASDPALTQADLLSGTATFDQMALLRVSVSGTAISAPVPVFTVASSLRKAFEVNLSASGWTGSVAPYNQTVTVAGMTSDWVPGVPCIVAVDDMASNQAAQAALACVSQITSAAGTLTFTCYEDKPATAVNLYVPGVML